MKKLSSHSVEKIRRILDLVNHGRAVVFGGAPCKDLERYTMHQLFAKYHNSVNVSMGVLYGHTENGVFTFFGGSSMNEVRDDENKLWFCWSTLDAPGQVLADLDYDFDHVCTALSKLIEL